MPNYLIEKDAQEKSNPLLISAHAMQHVSKERYDSVQNIYKTQSFVNHLKPLFDRKWLTDNISDVETERSCFVFF